MTSSKSTKRALLTSVLALLMCVTMLVGATFAWFTDSASTAVNKIQAGNLKVDLEMQNPNGSWVSAKGQTLEFKKAPNAPADEKVLWEPGCTYELPQLRVVNKGNLALKYKVVFSAINGDEDAMKLAEVLDVSLNGNKVGTLKDALTSTDPDGFAHGNLPAEGNSGELKITVQMQTTAGNDYQGLSIGGIAVTLLATQDTVEYDSTTNQYDVNAEYPVAANTQAELNDVIASVQSGSAIPTEVVLPAGEFKLENGTAQNKNITISGTKDTVVTVVGDTGNQMNYQNGATLAFEGVTIQGQTSGNYGGIAHVEETTFVNCTFNGKLTLYGDATFINCTFKNDSDYAIWTWGAKNVEFVNCTFHSGGKALLLYGGAGSTEAPTTNLTVTDCVFKDNNMLTTDKAAIEIGNDYNAVYNLTVNNITVNGFAVNPAGISTGSNIWANKNSMDQAHLNVVIDGVDVY